jgi:hypothetical protein
VCIYFLGKRFTAKLDFSVTILHRWGGGGKERGRWGVKRLQEFAPRSGQIHVLLIAQNTAKIYSEKVKHKGGFFGFFSFLYVIQHCVICRHSDPTVSQDAGIDSRTVATLAIDIDS